MAFDGLIIGGDVRVYDFTGANKGALLGSGKTNGQGRYSINLKTSDKPVLVEVDGGYYIEEASGVQVEVDKSKGHKMLAIEYYQSGRALDVSATFFTNVATGLYEYMVKEQGINDEVAVERAYAQVDTWLGFGSREVHPVDVSDVSNATPFMTDPHRYGFVAAGVSTISLEVGNESGANSGAGVHDFYTSIAFNRLAYEDVAFDGLLDGVGPSGRLSFGVRSLNSNTYRDMLALSMLRFATSDKNATGMSFDDLLPFASQINKNAGDLFGGVAAPDITAIKPTISQFVPANGVTMSGTYPVSVLVTDSTGIESIHFYVGDRYVAAASLRNGRADIDTTNFTNGSYVLRVEVTNFVGNTTHLSRDVTINNGQLAISIPSSAAIGGHYEWDDQYDIPTQKFVPDTCVVSVSIIDTTGLGVETLKVDGNLVWYKDPVAGGRKSVAVDCRIELQRNKGVTRCSRIRTYR